MSIQNLKKVKIGISYIYYKQADEARARLRRPWIRKGFSPGQEQTIQTEALQ